MTAPVGNIFTFDGFKKNINYYTLQSSYTTKIIKFAVYTDADLVCVKKDDNTENYTKQQAREYWSELIKEGYVWK